MEVADLSEVPDGLRITIRRSKTDPAGAGQEIAIPRGTHLRPVETLQAWLAAAAISAGPVFRPVSKGGRVGPNPLGDDGFVRALKRRAAAAGLDAAAFSGHSLRGGVPDLPPPRPAPTCSKMAEVSRDQGRWTRCGATSGAATCSRAMRAPGSCERTTACEGPPRRPVRRLTAARCRYPGSKPFGLTVTQGFRHRRGAGFGPKVFLELRRGVRSSAS